MRDQVVKAYLWLLVIALPMDWFGPTGALLREAGAKPAIPLMMLASVVLLATRYRTIVRSMPASTWYVTYRFAAIFACGLVAFVLNLIFGWSRFGGAKDPVTQFVTQAAMFVLTPVLIVMHAELFTERQWSSYVVRILPWAVGLHLLVLCLDIAGLVQYNKLPLSLFRTGSEAVSMRVSGMFSEPSYFGTMAALYGVPLLVAAPVNARRRNAVLALVLFGLALYTGGKTFLPVAICGLIGYAWFRRIRIFTMRNVLVALAIGAIAVTVVLRQSALDVRDNLSSAMRFGSTLTSVNVAVAGYGIAGVGFGQFHFMFQQKFMPTFLLFSQEAINQMASSAEQRTSTYNLFARYLVETGIVGLLLFLALLRFLSKLARGDRKPASLLGVLLISTSLGFLLTQDPYCYPPLILGAALILGAHNSTSALTTEVSV